MPLPPAASASWLQESQVELPQLQLQLAEAERKRQTLLEEMKALREVLFFAQIFQTFYIVCNFRVVDNLQYGN